ncbi:MAG: sigma-70 family RNA polymerase sigma factor [Ruminococcus sp.]|nr:sigma-70 family RNA polymerase sigma factor [Ruminococcus sp.]
MNHDKTAEYVKRILDGDTEAFSELYRMTYRRIYYICINFLKNRHDADDAVQETYLSAYRNLDRLDEPSKFFAWLERTAVNKCMDFLRKKVPVPEDNIEEIIEEEKTDILPEQYMTDFETRHIVINIMRETLSDLQYQTVFMYYFNNFTIRETAEIMNCSEGAVKNRLSTARSKIKAGVENYQDESGEKLYTVSVIPFLSAVFKEDFKNTDVPRIKGFLLKSLSKSMGKAGICMLKSKIIVGAVVSMVAVGGATAGLLSQKSENVPEESRIASVAVPEEEKSVTTEQTETGGFVSGTVSSVQTTKTVFTTTVTSTETTSSAVTSSYQTSSAVTETQTITEQTTEIITAVTEPVTEIREEPFQPETESVEKYRNTLDELNNYQDRFFEYVKITHDSTSGMIEMCRDKPINENFEGEERERFLEYSSLNDEYEQKIYDLFGETEEFVKSLENNPYYDYYVRAEQDLVDNNYGTPQGTYVGAVQQWYAINSNYDKLLEYLMSELETKLPAEAFSLIQHSETEWAEKHEYFLNNVIIYDGNWSNSSTGEFEARSRKYRCLMLMMYYCRTI